MMNRSLLFLSVVLTAINCQWNGSNYPNPLAEYFACNAEFNNGPNRICDPDKIFTDQERSSMNDLVNGLEGKTGQVRKEI